MTTFPFLGFGQNKDTISLSSLFSDFPIDSSFNHISQFCETHHFNKRASIYDELKSDYFSQILNDTSTYFKSSNSRFEFYFSIKHPIKDTILQEALVINRYLTYQESNEYNAEKQFDKMIKVFSNAYPHSKKIVLISEHGKEGTLVEFYTKKYSKTPVLIIELSNKFGNLPFKSRVIVISYIRAYPKD